MGGSEPAGPHEGGAGRPGPRNSRILKVVGMVNSDPSFTEQAAVVDGASDLFVALYGERGQPRPAPRRVWLRCPAIPQSSATA